jgi:leucyl/phenylalanyl-tRNA--protein transferase
MFSRATDASKIALAWLVARLKLGDFALLDCQFMTEHLASLGAIEIPQADYLVLLEAALTRFVQASSGLSSSSAAAGAGAGDWGALDGFLASAAGAASSGADSTASSSPGKLILQLLTQTS